MLGRLLLAGLALLALAQDALANGRTAAVRSITFRRGMEAEIVAGASYGILISADGGATWRWYCEDAPKYSGTYDPSFTYGSTGAWLVTTQEGIKATRDGCRFEPTPLAGAFVQATAHGPDGAVYAIVQDKVYKSTDLGQSFPLSSMPGTAQDLWLSVAVAPSDPDRVYLTGFRTAGGKVNLVSRSLDGGQTWTPLPVGNFMVMSNATIEIAGVSRTDPALLYARVVREDNDLIHAIYRSTNGGQSWTRLLGRPVNTNLNEEKLSFLVRGNGELVVGTPSTPTARSTNMGDTWEDLPGAPHAYCLTETAAGEVWACTRNIGTTDIPSDGASIMKSTDLLTWTRVLRFQEILEPVACSDGTTQRDTCDLELWCGLCQQLSCDPKRICPELAEAPARGGGCCETGGGAVPGALALAAFVSYALARRRRPRRPAS